MPSQSDLHLVVGCKIKVDVRFGHVSQTLSTLYDLFSIAERQVFLHIGYSIGTLLPVQAERSTSALFVAQE
jgi:hypothetical protein